MKKMFSVLLAAAALAGVGVAQADQGACVTRGICDNVNPEHGGDAYGNYDVRLAEQRGLVPPGTAQAWSGGYGPPPVVANGGWVPWNGTPYYGAATPYYGTAAPYYGTATPYARTRRDRDGDGIPNNRDRYPDDPRYQ